jgi:hypothetical protein
MSLLPTDFGILLTVFKELGLGVQWCCLSILVPLNINISECVMLLGVLHPLPCENTTLWPVHNCMSVCHIFPRRQATCMAGVTVVQQMAPIVIVNPIVISIIIPNAIVVTGPQATVAPGAFLHGSPALVAIPVATLVQE